MGGTPDGLGNRIECMWGELVIVVEETDELPGGDLGG